MPQGSVLGPILFLAYVSPLGDVIRKYGLDFHFFADDSQIYLSFESGDPLKQEIAFETINCVISDTRSWMAANFMMMNDDKTELAIFGTRQQLNKFEHPLSIISGEELVFPSEKIRNLGVILNPCLRLHLHINNIIRVCVFHLRNIAKIRKFLTFDAYQAVHAFVSSRLDYCNALLYGLPSCQLNRLQLIQNSAARLVLQAKPRDHVIPLLKQLHWLPVRERTIFKVCLLTFKALNGSASSCITDLLKKHLPTRSSLRSASDISRLAVPATNSRAQHSTADRTFLSVPLDCGTTCLRPLEAPHLLTLLGGT